MSDEENNDEICGAETLSGGTCKKPGGWGTDRDDGYCKDHVKGAKEDLKKQFIDTFSEDVMTIKEAAHEIGKTPQAIWKWRQADEEFDEKVLDIKNEYQQARTEMVKDAVYERIVNGDASASLTIFWLKNNVGWKTDPETVVNVAQKNESDGLSSDDFHEVFDEYVDEENEEEESSGESSEGERCKNSD